jgi:hypothetical protein
MNTVGSIILGLTLLVTAAALTLLLLAPFVSELIADLRLRRIREQQAQTEARLRMLTQFTILRMHQAARQQPDDKA